jgi:MFS family permease
MVSIGGLRSAVPRPVLSVGLVMSLALLGDSLLYVALPAHAAELSLPLWSVGILLGANRIVRLVTNGLAARAFNRVGGRGPVIGASIAAAATTAAYGLTPAFVPFLLARAAWGACFSVLRLGAFTVVLGASAPASRGRLVGVYQSISRIGPVLSLLLGGLAVEIVGYHLAFAMLGLVSLLGIPLAVSLRASAYGSGTRRIGQGDHARSGVEDHAATPRESPTWRERWLGGPRLVAVKLGMLANGFAAQGVVLATLTLALTEVADTAEGAALLGGLLVAIRWGFDLTLAPLCGHISDRVGRGRMIPALLLAEGVVVAALALADDRTGVVVATLTIFLISTAMAAASDAAAGDLAPPHRRAEVMSSYSDWIDVGAALGPPLAFILADWLGLRANYALTGLILLVVGAHFTLAWRRERDGDAVPGDEELQ